MRVSEEIYGVTEQVGKSVVVSLFLFDDYFERTGYSSGRADHLALAAPSCADAAFAIFYMDHKIFFQNQGITGAYLHAESAPVTFIRIYYDK